MGPGGIMVTPRFPEHPRPTPVRRSFTLTLKISLRYTCILTFTHFPLTHSHSHSHADTDTYPTSHYAHSEYTHRYSHIQTDTLKNHQHTHVLPCPPNMGEGWKGGRGGQPHPLGLGKLTPPSQHLVGPSLASVPALGPRTVTTVVSGTGCPVCWEPAVCPNLTPAPFLSYREPR